MPRTAKRSKTKTSPKSNARTSARTAAKTTAKAAAKTSAKTAAKTGAKASKSARSAAGARRKSQTTAQTTAAAEDQQRPPRSDKPARVLAFLREFMGANGYPPSVRDVVDGCKLSSTSVADYNLRILERQGHIRRDPERARTIVLTEPLAPTAAPQPVAEVEPLQIPLLGAIAAGARVVAPDGSDAKHADEHLQVTPDMLGGRDPAGLFAVTVRGDSMIDALIADGDTVIFEHAQTVENGQLGAFWLRDENISTLKRFYREGRRVRLQPENPTMEPIYTAPANLEIQGRVVSILRQPN